MVSDFYEAVLSELAQALDIKELRPDSNNTCLIHFQNEVEVQIEPFQKGEALLIVTNLGKIPPGTYREQVFKEALRANGKAWPRHGVFCFSDQSDCLLLYKLMSLKEINGERVASFILPFIEKAAKWKEALEAGQVPVVDSFTTSSPRSGMFGL